MSSDTAPTTEIRRLGRVPAFDGVRGAAVLLVVWSHIGILHALPTRLKPKGGFLGVDVFFVLSGFLITAILLGEQRVAGRIDFRAFYRRRALRLLPVIFAFLVAHVVFTQLVIHGPADRERESIPAALLFFTNWHAIYSRLPVAFGHLWSLAVEEQFYLVWPAVMTLLTVRTRLKTSVAVLGSALLGVCALRAYMWHDGAQISRVLLGTDTHCDGLIAGALLAHVWVRGRAPRRGLRYLASAASAAVIASVLLFDFRSSFLYLGGYTLVSVAVAVVLLAILDTNWIGGHMFAHPALRAVGRVSYGLYMWHPLTFWWVMHETAHMSRGARLSIGLAVTAATTIASWLLVERPFLRRKDRLSR